MERCKSECVMAIACRLKRESLEKLKADLLSEAQDKQALLRDEVTQDQWDQQAVEIASGFTAIRELVAVEAIDRVNERIVIQENLMIDRCRGGPLILDDPHKRVGITIHCGGLDAEGAQQFVDIYAAEIDRAAITEPKT